MRALLVVLATILLVSCATGTDGGGGTTTSTTVSDTSTAVSEVYESAPPVVTTRPPVVDSGVSDAEIDQAIEEVCSLFDEHDVFEAMDIIIMSTLDYSDAEIDDAAAGIWMAVETGCPEYLDDLGMWANADL